MFTCRAILATALILAGLCNGQQVVLNLDDSPQLIRNVLKDAHVSGSLAYSAICKSASGRSPVVPHVGTPRRSGSPTEVLQSMFGNRTTIRVTEEPNGLVRMAEAEPISGPPFALVKILAAPEVEAFMKEHDIRTGAFRIEGIYPQLPDIPGELYDVTVSEALDYVLRTFPGYWVYEDCTTPEGTRSVNFGFY